MTRGSTTSPASSTMDCAYCHKVVDGSAVVHGGVVYHSECVKPAARAARGLLYDCPQCNRTGKIKDPDRAREEMRDVPVAKDERGFYPCAYDDCRGCSMCRSGTERKRVRVVPDKVCPLCAGEGYLTKSAEPVTEVVTKGWRLKP